MASYDVWNCIFNFTRVANLAQWMRINHLWKRRIIKSLSFRRRFTINLEIKYNYFDDISKYQFIAKYCQNLYYIDFGINMIGMRNILQLITNMSKLKYIFLPSLIYSASVNNNLCNYAILCSLSLTIRVLSIPTEIITNSANLISDRFGASLEGLYIKFNPKEFSINNIIKKCPNLVVLFIDTGRFEINQLEINLPNCRYLYLPMSCKRFAYDSLVELDLRNVRFKSGEFKIFANRLTNIKRLTILSMPISVFGEIIDILYNRQIMPHLEILSLVIGNLNISPWKDVLSGNGPRFGLIIYYYIFSDITINFKSTCIRANILN